jgi:hypothetical protein
LQRNVKRSGTHSNNNLSLGVYVDTSPIRIDATNLPHLPKPTTTYNGGSSDESPARPICPSLTGTIEDLTDAILLLRSAISGTVRHHVTFRRQVAVRRHVAVSPHADVRSHIAVRPLFARTLTSLRPKVSDHRIINTGLLTTLLRQHFQGGAYPDYAKSGMNVGAHWLDPTVSGGLSPVHLSTITDSHRCLTPRSLLFLRPHWNRRRPGAAER